MQQKQEKTQKPGVQKQNAAKKQHLKTPKTTATKQQCRSFFTSGQTGPTGPKPQVSGRLPLVARLTSVFFSFSL